VDAHHLAGEDAEGLRVAQEGLRRFPNDPYLLECRVAVLAAGGRDDELARALDAWYHATTRSDRPPGDAQIVLMELRRHERRTQLAETAARLLAGADALGTRARPDEARLFRATVLWTTDRWAAAEAALAPVSPSAPEFTEALRLRAQIAARRGNRGEALRLTSEFGAREPGARHNRLRASVHALLGDRGEAALLFGAPSRDSFLWQRAHWDLALEGIRDDPAFRALAAPRDEEQDGADAGR
jgi:hypothetical protein